MEVESFSIDSEREADDYLSSLLETPQYRSADEIGQRAAMYVKDAILRVYFVTQGTAMLRVLALNAQGAGSA